MSFVGHAPGSPAYRRLILGLFFAGIATFAQLYAPQAVLPQLARDLAVDPATAALSVSAATLGLAASVIGWSVVADRIGRVPAMAIGAISATTLGLLAPFGGDIGILLALRCAEGIALGAVPAIALAYLAEEVGPRHAAAAAGSYIAGTTVGGLSGRVVSGLVAEVAGWRAEVWAATGLCAVAVALFLWLAPRSQGFVPLKPRAVGTSVITRLLGLLRSTRQLALYAQGFLLMGAFVAVYNYLGFHLAAPPFALPAWLLTLLFLAYLAGTASSPWAGVLASRGGRYPVLLGSIAVMAGGAALLLVPLTVVVLLGLVLFTAGFFGAHAVASGWAPVAASAESRAQASSLYYFAYYAGSSLFGWALGIVFGAGGWAWFAGIVIGMCALAALAAGVALRPADPSSPGGIGRR